MAKNIPNLMTYINLKVSKVERTPNIISKRYHIVKQKDFQRKSRRRKIVHHIQGLTSDLS